MRTQEKPPEPEGIMPLQSPTPRCPAWCTSRLWQQGPAEHTHRQLARPGTRLPATHLHTHSHTRKHNRWPTPQSQGRVLIVQVRLLVPCSRASKLRGRRGRLVWSEEEEYQRSTKPAGPGLLSEDPAVVSPGGRARLSHERCREKTRQNERDTEIQRDNEAKR